MKAFVVLLDVNKTDDGRGLAEKIDGMVFANDPYGEQDFIRVRDKVKANLLSLDKEFDDDALAVYSLSDFVDTCNDSDNTFCEINIMNVWLAHVYLSDLPK